MIPLLCLSILISPFSAPNVDHFPLDTRLIITVGKDAQVVTNLLNRSQIPYLCASSGWDEFDVKKQDLTRAKKILLSDRKGRLAWRHYKGILTLWAGKT